MIQCSGAGKNILLDVSNTCRTHWVCTGSVPAWAPTCTLQQRHPQGLAMHHTCSIYQHLVMKCHEWSGIATATWMAKGPSCLQFALHHFHHVESENHCLICAACFRQSWRLHWTKGWFTSGPRSTDLHWKPRMGWPIGWPLMKEPIWRRWAKSLSIRPCWEWLSGRFRGNQFAPFFFLVI